MKELGIELLDAWPPQSPDLNPIEHLWALVKRRLNSYVLKPRSMHELWERVQAVWAEITREECAKLVESMPVRLRDCIEAKGRWTKW